MDLTGYVEDPTLPAGDGWCEVVVSPLNHDPDRYCCTHAKWERDGHRICGLHRNPAKPWRYGPLVPDAGD